MHRYYVILLVKNLITVIYLLFFFLIHKLLCLLYLNDIHKCRNTRSITPIIKIVKHSMFFDSIIIVEIH